jgi:NAD(P)-dependent dehydrogenase (short-subunit alcohol dehydrogenase family)
VVTGGSRGIGRATARLLAQRGAAVCVNYAMHPDAAEALVAEITTAGGRAIAVVADVADSAAVEFSLPRQPRCRSQPARRHLDVAAMWRARRRYNDAAPVGRKRVPDRQMQHPIFGLMEPEFW